MRNVGPSQQSLPPGSPTPGTLRASSAARLARQQRTLLAAAAAMTAVYYVGFALAGIYPLRAAAVGLGIPLLLSITVWASRAGVTGPTWTAAAAAGVPAIALVTDWLSGRTGCIGFHVFWAMPLLLVLIAPYSLLVTLAGSAVSAAGGVAIMILDGLPAAKVAQWSVLAAGACVLAVARVRLSRLDLQVLREEERAAEAGLLEARKLESVGRLAGGVAHDFNNLLTVILSCAATLEEDLATGRACAPEDAESIRVAGERARDLVQRLLAFGRQQLLSPQRIDLNDVLHGAEPLLRRVLGSRVRLELALADGLWPVRCDRASLERAVLNLVVNARDAMPEGGDLRIATENVARPPADRGKGGAETWVCVRVEDTGTGLSPEVRDHLFEPFFTTKGQGKGTGLGLASVHGNVTQAGGRIEVASEPGRGTRFDILLPRHAAGL
jgi:signal transduction histidine kinase